MFDIIYDGSVVGVARRTACLGPCVTLGPGPPRVRVRAASGARRTDGGWRAAARVAVPSPWRPASHSREDSLFSDLDLGREILQFTGCYFYFTVIYIRLQRL